MKRKITKPVVTQDKIILDMYQIIDAVNNYYCRSDGMTSQEKDLFKQTKNALDMFDQYMNVSQSHDDVDLEKITGWQTHIYVKFRILCADYGITMRDATAPNRTKGLVDIRQKIAKALDKGGFTITQIAWVMQRDRSTINNLLKYRKKQLTVV